MEFFNTLKEGDWATLTLESPDTVITISFCCGGTSGGIFGLSVWLFVWFLHEKTKTNARKRKELSRRLCCPPPIKTLQTCF